MWACSGSSWRGRGAASKSPRSLSRAFDYCGQRKTVLHVSSVSLD
jgi:hypothetical protein